MKKLLLIFAIICFTIGAIAQRPATVVSLTNDTLTDAETSYITIATFTGNHPFGVQILATKLTGTTAGTMVLEGSIDGTSWNPILDETNVMKAYADDTLTVIDGAVGTWLILNNIYYKYRFNVTSTGTHTTKLTGTLYYKK